MSHVPAPRLTLRIFMRYFLRYCPLPILLGLLMFFLFGPPAQAQPSSRYVVLDAPQPSDTPDKIEVLGFFAYSCNHCAAIEPLIERWKPSLPDDVVYRPTPVAFNAGMMDMQKFYYTLESLNRLDLHPKVFIAIHNEKKRLFTARAITDWAVGQGINRGQFEAAFKSFSVQVKASRASELGRLYQIEGTPAFGVAGKYMTAPSLTGDYQSALNEVSRLLQTRP